MSKDVVVVVSSGVVSAGASVRDVDNKAKNKKTIPKPKVK